MNDPVREFQDAIIVRNVVAAVTEKLANAFGTPLYGHKDEATAYVVDDYPYGFKLRTQIRYWLEMNSKKGFRFVSQTLNPKNGRWNAPKKSTYIDWGAAMYLDSQGHVTWTGVGQYTDAAKILAFVKAFPGSDMTFLKKVIPMKIRYYEMRAGGESGMTMNGQKVEVSEHEQGEARENIEIFKDALKYVQ